MRGAESSFPVFQAREKPSSDSSSALTSMVTVPLKPCSGFQKEVSSQVIPADEVVAELPVSDMSVVTFSCFVVVAQHAFSPHDQREAVLEVVIAASQRPRQAPDHDLRRSVLAKGSLDELNLDRVRH